MKTFISLLALVVLTGCASKNGFNNTEVLVSKQYVIRTAPDILKTLPPLPATLPNPNSATNSQVAIFINNTEEYITNLEAMISTLVDFYEKPVLASEIGAMKAITPIMDKAGRRIVQPQAETIGANTISTTAAPAPESAGFWSSFKRIRATK